MPRAELEHELEQLHPASFAWALQCCRRNRDDAEEVLQNTYVTVLDGASFDGRSSLKTWLFGVIRRKAIGYYRGRAIRRALLLRFDGGSKHSPVQTHDDLAGALMQLAQRQREVIELVFYHDLTVEEAAAIMDVGVGSARVHYDRAKKKLRVLLEAKS